MSPFNISSGFHTGQSNGTDKLFFSKDEDDQYWQDGHQRSGHHDLVFGRGFLHQIFQSDGKRTVFRFGRDDQRPGVALPVSEEGEERSGGNGAFGIRNDYTRQNPEIAAAVKFGGIDQILWNGIKVAHQQKGGEGCSDLREYDTGIGIQPSERCDQKIHRNHRHDGRNKQTAAHKRQEEFLARIIQLGDGISCQDGDDDLEDGLDDGGHDTVEIISPEGDHLENLGEVIPFPLGRNPARRIGVYVRFGFKCGENHPYEREQHEYGTDGKDDEDSPVITVDFMPADMQRLN